MDSRFQPVREALRQHKGVGWIIQHLDITCDGCEQEPIEGERFKCTVCEDIDLCGRCMRVLVAARIKAAEEAGPPAPPRPAEAARPRRWVHKLRSRDGATKWAALQTAVPCLHPSHRFARLDHGPERAVVYLGSGGGSGSSSGSSAEAPAPPEAAAVPSSLPAGEAPPSSSSSSSSSSLEAFLRAFPPSQSSCSDLAWICTEAPPAQQRQQPAGDAAPGPSGAAAAAGAAARQLGAARLGSLEERVDAAVEEWEVLAAARRPSAADVDALARKHSILKAKWMAFPSSQEVDAAWAAVARSVAAGSLGSSAKVSTVSPGDEGRHVLCAYVDNYLDGDDVARAADGLRQALVGLSDRRLLLKPDIYTHLGVYSGNEWGLKPTTASLRL